MSTNIFRRAIFYATFFVCFAAASAQVQQQLPTRHVHEQVKNGHAPIVGLLPGTLRMRLAIMLQLHNTTELDDLIQRLYDPKSSSYGQYLSVQEFTDRFGPSTQEYERVVSFAEANGMRVTGRSANRMVVEVTASAWDIERAFHLAIGIYQHPTENRLFYAPDREPSVDLDVPLWHISGLDNFSMPHAASGPGTPAGGSGGSGSGPGGSFIGSDMRAAYYGGTSLTGSGQVVGLVEFGGYNLSDVQTYFKNVGQTLSVPINNVLLGGFNGVCGSCNDSEAALDIEQTISMAPGLSNLIVYEVPYVFGNGGDVLIFNRMASDNTAKQLSCSWFWFPADSSSDDPIFKQFAAQGQSLLSASGDWGAIPNSQGWYFPAEDPNVTAVGGTDLTTTGPGGSWQSEIAWSSSGGGISPDNLPIPSYQQLSGVINSTNKGSTTERNVPDVAAQADYVNYICYSGTCVTNWGGTSFSAPRWAGFVALANQQAEANGQPFLGFLNPTIYPIGVGPTYASYFHDIASGTNGAYSAVAGYDLVTGWGSPSSKGWFTFPLTITKMGTGTGSVTSSPAGINCGATCTANFTTGTTVILTASASAGSVFTGWSGACSGTGTCTVNMSAAVSVTATFVIPDFTLTTTQGSQSAVIGGTGSFAVNVTGIAFTGTVALAVSGGPTGMTATLNPTSISGGSGGSVLTVSPSTSVSSGAYSLTITGTSGTLTHSATVQVIVPVSVTVSPATVVLGNGQTRQFSATVLGTSNSAVTWSVGGVGIGAVGTINSTGLFTAPALLSSSSTNSVQACSAVSPAACGGATVTLSAQPTFTISTTSLAGSKYELLPGGNVTVPVGVRPYDGFTGTVALSVNNLPNGVTASFNPGSVSITNASSQSSTLTLTASASAAQGTFTPTVTGTSGTLSNSTTFNLGVALALTVSPATVTLSNGQTQQFTAAVGGTTTTAVTWTQSPIQGNSTLSSTGLFTAPNPIFQTGASTVTACSTLVPTNCGSATVNETNSGYYVTGFNVTLPAGTGSAGTVWVSDVLGGATWTGTVTLSIAGLPAGVTASFNPSTVTITNSLTGIRAASTLTLTSTASTPVGSYTPIVTAKSGSITETTTLGLQTEKAPVISSLSVSSGAVGSGVTIYGSGFGTYLGTGSATLTVSFNGATTSPSIIDWSNTQIGVSVPAGATTGNLTVYLGGVASNQVPFNVVLAPAITSLSPSSGVLGSTLVINGLHFGATQGTGMVSVGYGTGSVVSWSDQQIVVTVPFVTENDGTTSSSPVEVKAGGVWSNALTYVMLPSITSAQPSSGAAGTQVLIYGSALVGPEGANPTVTFNGVSATINNLLGGAAAGYEALVVTVPVGATSGNILVNAGGLVSNPIAFVVH